MRILAVDIGTGTQDILLFDSRVDVENSFKLIVPSPTMMVHSQIKEATRLGQAILLDGVMMGGGPSQWAADAHLRAGLPVYATTAAAKSFNDDLEAVQQMGITLLSEDEVHQLGRHVRRITLADFDLPAIQRAFEPFGIHLDNLDAVAVAVFDHGDSPPGYSDRQFRFDYLDRRIRSENRLSAFAYLADKIPSEMTRLQAVVQSARSSASSLLQEVPLIVMDTAPAAVLGVTLDTHLVACQRIIIVNVGNFHTLAFRLGEGGIEGVFEHHTGLLDQSKLDHLIISLADGTLLHGDVFDDHGHGALMYSAEPLSLNNLATPSQARLAISGPRRSLMRNSSLDPYFAVPFGDMMIAGCFGLLAAVADLLPEFTETLRLSLSGKGSSSAPWED